MQKESDIRWNEVRSRCWIARKTDIVQAGNWDPEFVGYGEEDIELAYRLYQTCRTRFRVLYLADCLGVHVNHRIHHRRQDRQWAHNGAVLIKKHPELRKERLEFFENMGLGPLLRKELSVHEESGS